MDDRAVSTILILHGIDWVMPMERRGEKFILFYFTTSSLFKLLSLKFKCQPARERVADREREEELRSAGRKPLKTHRHASHIQSDELLKGR